MQRFNTCVRVTFLHTRKRIIDVDNISGKAAIDGLVAAGVLRDDSPKYVAQITHVQAKCKKGEKESTKIIVEEIDDER